MTPPEQRPAAAAELRSRRKSRASIPIRIVIETTEKKGDPPVEEPTQLVEEFDCVGSVPGAVLMDVAASMTGDGTWQSASIQRLFDAAIPDDQKDRWAKVLSHEDAPDLGELAEIADYLIGRYGENPTESA